MTKLKPIPRSRAKTAWGLIQDVKRAILAEPKRADMTTFQEEKSLEDGGPACGTVGCFAGWVCLLRGHREGSFAFADAGAKDILGPNLNYLTVAGPNFVFNSGGGDACWTTKPGTKAHARAVVARINKFARINEQALKARKLPAVRS